MNTEECRNGRVDACHLHGYQAKQLCTPAPAAVAFHANAANVEFFHLGQDFEWESIFDPVLRDDGRDLCLHESANLFHNRQLFSGQCFDEFIEVAIGRR